MPAKKERLMEIKGWKTGDVLFSGNYNSLKECLLAALAGEADLRGADLRGANLREANLREANLREANLYEANLYGADLRGANLRGANLRGANLRGANLYGANLREANLYEANLYEANLPELSVSIQAGEEYWLFISPEYVVAGCQKHTAQEWREMTKKQITDMDGEKAVNFYPRLLDLLDFFVGKGDRPDWVEQQGE